MTAELEKKRFMRTTGNGIMMQWPTASFSPPDPQKSGEICLYILPQPVSVAKLPFSDLDSCLLLQIQKVSDGFKVCWFVQTIPYVMQWTSAHFCNVFFILCTLRFRPQMGWRWKDTVAEESVASVLLLCPTDRSPYLFPPDLICVWFFFFFFYACLKLAMGFTSSLWSVLPGIGLVYLVYLMMAS